MTPPEWTLGDFIYKGHWWRHRGILVLNICIILPLMTASISGLDSSLVNGLQILPSWQKFFGYPQGSALGILSTAQNLGAICGLPIAPFCSDILGRRYTIFIGALIMLAGVITQFASRTVPVFIGARIIIGFGLTLSVNAAPLLITELAYPTHRGKISSMFNTAWYSGSILSAWACFTAYDRAGSSLWSWKAPSLVQAVGPLLQICLVWFIPESPRYLMSRGLDTQAAQILAHYHASDGDVRNPLIQYEMAQIRHAIKQEKEVSESRTFWQIWSTPGNLKRLRIIIGIAMFSQWSGNGLVSYYISLVLKGIGITNPRTQAEINGGLQIFNFASAILGSFLVDYVGRRPLFIFSNLGMLIVFAMWTLTTALFTTLHNTAAAKATVPLIFVYYFCYDVCYTPLVVSYTLEILPYSIRAKGFAIMNLTVLLTVAFNQFVNPIALEAIGWKYYIVYCAWLVFELGFVLRYIVETKGRTLEETAAIFDGEQPPEELAHLGAEAAVLDIGYTDGLTLDIGREKSNSNVYVDSTGRVVTPPAVEKKEPEWVPDIYLDYRPNQPFRPRQNSYMG